MNRGREFEYQEPALDRSQKGIDISWTRSLLSRLPGSHSQALPVLASTMHVSPFCRYAVLLLSPHVEPCGAQKTAQKQLLSKIKTLTFGAGSKTAGRRLKPMQQLQCVSGDAKGYYEVEAMICQNMGGQYDTEDIQWSCTADSMPTDFKVGSTEVICEGFKDANDPYVLRGSCACEYTLHFTDEGYAKYGRERPFRMGRGWGINGGALIQLIFYAIFALILYRLLKGCWGQNQRRPHNRGWWGGGDDNDPPPPYNYPPKPDPNAGQEPWRPGFWSGLMGGASGSYLANQMGNRNANRYGQDQPGFGSPNRGVFDRGGPSSAPSGMGPTHSSTGFGGTRRR